MSGRQDHPKFSFPQKDLRCLNTFVPRRAKCQKEELLGKHPSNEWWVANRGNENFFMNFWNLNTCMSLKQNKNL